MPDDRTDRAEMEKAWEHATWETGQIDHTTDKRIVFEAGWQAKARVLVGQQEQLREALAELVRVKNLIDSGEDERWADYEEAAWINARALVAASPEPQTPKET